MCLFECFPVNSRILSWVFMFSRKQSQIITNCLIFRSSWRLIRTRDFLSEEQSSSGPTVIFQTRGSGNHKSRFQSEIQIQWKIQIRWKIQIPTHIFFCRRWWSFPLGCASSLRATCSPTSATRSSAWTPSSSTWRWMSLGGWGGCAVGKDDNPPWSLRCWMFIGIDSRGKNCFFSNLVAYFCVHCNRTSKWGEIWEQHFKKTLWFFIQRTRNFIEFLPSLSTFLF